MEKLIIKDVRKFNRYYTNLMGILDQGYLATPYTLTEARILSEISAKDNILVSSIIEALLIDKGYLSRVLRNLEKTGLVKRSKTQNDARAIQVSLTERGRDEVGLLNVLADTNIEGLLNSLSTAEQRQLAHHMNSITEILDKANKNK